MQSVLSALLSMFSMILHQSSKLKIFQYPRTLELTGRQLKHCYRQVDNYKLGRFEMAYTNLVRHAYSCKLDPMPEPLMPCSDRNC